MRQIVVCITLTALVGVGCATAPPPVADPAPVAAAPTPTPTPPVRSAWPPLPSAFISGRAATPEDVQAGRAVFAAQAQGLGEGRALEIAIPQYAFCSPDGAPIPGIVVQAEHAQGTDLVGFRPLAGSKGYVTLLSGCNLLGQSPPPNGL